jgi:hypothetical protein
MPHRVPVTITTARLTATGEKNHKSVRTSTSSKRSTEDVHLGITWRRVPGTEVIEVPVEAHTNRFTPDRYAGTLRLSLENGQTPVPIPVDIAVKDGPLNAALAFVFGVVLAAIVRAAKRHNERSDLETEIEKVRQRANSVIPLDAARVAPALDRAAAAVRAGRLAEAREIALAVEKRVEVLRATRAIENTFPDPPWPERLEKVRDLVSAELDEQATAALAQIKKELGQLPGAAKEETEALIDNASRLSALAAGHMLRAQRLGFQPRRTVRLLAWLGGLDNITVAMSRHVTRIASRAAVFASTIGSVLFVALMTHYFKGSDTFGADMLWDYGALIAAGFTGAVTGTVAANAKRPDA